MVREVHNHAWGSQKKHKHGKQRQSGGCATDRVFDKMKRAVVHLWGSRYWGSPWKLIWRIYGWNRTVSEVCFRTTRRVVGAMHGQPGVCVQSLVLDGASQSLLPHLACPSLTRPDAGRLIQQCHLWVRWSLCALLERQLHEGEASLGTSASSVPGTENLSSGSSGTFARAWDFP